MTPQERTVRARNAVLIVFAANGAIFASLASRFPDIKSILGLTAGQLGATLLAGATGAILGLPASGWLTHRFGAANTIRLGSLAQLAGYVVAASAINVFHSRLLLAAGLFFGAIGMGIWDVGMNLHGASVERRLGRTVMPWFHAAFSAGTVAGALVGAVMAFANVPVTVHVAGATALGVAVTWWAIRSFLPRRFEAETEADTSGIPADGSAAPTSTPKAGVGAAWREPRTLIVGVMVLVAALTEGTANDWVAVALHEGYHLPTWAGVLGFAIFLSSMTLGRILGARLLDKYGRVPVLRVPVGMSAAADDPRRAAARMSVVSSIGYIAFLAGPPMLGFLGDHYGVLRSLLVVGLAAIVALLVVPAAAEPNPPRSRDGRAAQVPTAS